MIRPVGRAGERVDGMGGMTMRLEGPNTPEKEKKTQTKVTATGL